MVNKIVDCVIEIIVKVGCCFEDIDCVVFVGGFSLFGVI